ncbi:DUF4760 domain-containing protein [Vibrio crassostreae]|uniref:hypothetical protein n=1 Tax=Vibrio crassostreae TaxID=246167 RepID=UPI000F47FEB2|nr:hypothetical protein [Vibrio crassostreae]ROO76932.1 hypothetical protein EDB53_0761 [Vibrio crassostreae]ROR70345.1 hypothetical protein EDB59_0998 [Vibrio crassostreae]ROR75497.1 hypothetical protein EDB54_1008 [Vibrio crassostreae]ROR86608.1 hypothetical protein EDB55_1300 [Vibrio crassostreae]TCV32948.1 hypothetical protein EDB70_101934 [Vibrio crassostreae]
MICLDTNAAQLLTLVFWNDRADIVMMIIASIALVFSIKQILSGRKESRRATAYAIYQEYLKLCFDNTTLAYGNQSEIVQDGKTNPKYPWFVSQMLFAFEQILETDKSDEEWKTSIKSQLELHAWYLKESSTANRAEWNKELKVIIKQVTSETSLQPQEDFRNPETTSA